MEIKKKDWPLSSIFGIRERINTNPDFQRPPVWGKAQRQLLIDTILRDYDIPKLYWRKTGSKPDTYDVVDGQQRLRTIWSFFNDEFKLPKDSDNIDGEDVSGCAYSTLPDDLRIRFDTYNLQVVMLEDTDEDEVREIILKLADKGLTSEKIGLVLRDQYGIPKTKIYNIKIGQVMKEKNKFVEPALLNLQKRAERIEEHYKKNKQDKKAGRSLIVVKAKLKKVKDYLKA